MKVSTELKEAYNALLKNEVEDTFGKKIASSRDCVVLSEKIYLKTSFKVNPNTLRRFFGLVKSSSFASPTTLDILSNFCDFDSLDHFINLRDRSNKVNGNKDYYADSILDFITGLFKNTPIVDSDDINFYHVTKETFHFIQRHPECSGKFQRAISKTKNGQLFYYEQFIHIDKLNSSYGDGLRYYLLEKKGLEAQVFGHSLLCMRYWLNENSLGVKKHHDEVIKYQLPRGIPSITCARYMVTLLMHADSFDLNVEKILHKLQQIHNSFKVKAEHKSFPFFEYIVSQILLYIGYPEEALYYINYALHKYPERSTSKDAGLYESMYLTQALSYFKLGKLKQADKLYQRLHPSEFHFLTKKTDTIIYLILTDCLNKIDTNTDRQLKELILETGFTRFHKLFR